MSIRKMPCTGIAVVLGKKVTVAEKNELRGIILAHFWSDSL
jgi:hypothetical protein